MELPEGVKDDLGVHGKVDVVLESGPRSIRPRGSKGAAQMLKLVSIEVRESFTQDFAITDCD
jgi:hypothetical protein